MCFTLFKLLCLQVCQHKINHTLTLPSFVEYRNNVLFNSI